MQSLCDPCSCAIMDAGCGSWPGVCMEAVWPGTSSDGLSLVLHHLPPVCRHDHLRAGGPLPLPGGV